MVIEVKDWILDHYYLDEKRKWRLSKNNAYIKSPVDQVYQYKENLYNLHIENLLEKNIRNSKHWNVIACAVYFHNETKESIDNFLVTPFKENRKYQDFLKYNIALIGHDSLTKQNFDNLLSLKRLDGSINSLFNNDIYLNLIRYLQPPKHTYEQGKPIKYKTQQSHTGVILHCCC